ncbi:hypothetical protein T310_10126, partial [Rasamsonia emersonii CBS 393.64]
VHSGISAHIYLFFPSYHCSDFPYRCSDISLVLAMRAVCLTQLSVRLCFFPWVAGIRRHRLAIISSLLTGRLERQSSSKRLVVWRDSGVWKDSVV